MGGGGKPGSSLLLFSLSSLQMSLQSAPPPWLGPGGQRPGAEAAPHQRLAVSAWGPHDGCNSVTLTADKAPRPARRVPGLLRLISRACQQTCPHLLLAQLPWAHPAPGFLLPVYSHALATVPRPGDSHLEVTPESQACVAGLGRTVHSGYREGPWCWRFSAPSAGQLTISRIFLGWGAGGGG